MRIGLFVVLLSTAALAQRPALSGPVERHPTADGSFLVHFTRQGADAVLLGDNEPQNGVPDEVDDVETGLARGWAVFIDEDGWTPPPPDEGRGGDDRLDVYVRDIDVFGYAHYERTAGGRSTSYFEIDPGNSGLGRVLARSIAAHELHHGFQAAVTTGVESWIYEATSTWAQHRAFANDPDLELLRGLTWLIRLQGAGRRLDDVGGRFEYAGMTWIEFLLDRSRLPRAGAKDLWRAMAQAGGWEAGHRAFLAPTTLEDAVAEYAVWNLFACRRADGHHYDGDLSCTLDGEVPTTRATPPASGVTPELGRFGAAYVELEQDCRTATLDLRVQSPGPFALRAVRVRAAGASPVEAAGGTGVSTLSLPGWNDEARLVLVLVNLGAAPAVFSWDASATGTYTPAPDPLGARRLAVTPVAVAPLAVGEAVQLEATGHFGSCANGAPVTARAAWTSTAPGVATVDGGHVTAVAPGTAEIYVANATSESNRVAITVEPRGCGCSAAGAGPWLLGIVVLAARRRAGRRAPARQ